MTPAALRQDDTAPRADVNFESLLQTLDREFANYAPAKIEKFHFELDGIVFDIRNIKQGERCRFLINARMGYLPFSIESIERRNIIKTIVLSSTRLPSVRFNIDHMGKITAGALFDITKMEFPDFVFYPLIMFLQQARPFMNLIGKYLQPMAGEAAAQTTSSSPSGRDKG